MPNVTLKRDEPHVKKVQSDCKAKIGKHASTFNHEWKTGGPWLMHVEGSGMYCRL